MKTYAALRQVTEALMHLPEGGGPGKTSPEQHIGLATTLGTIDREEQSPERIDAYLEELCSRMAA